MIKGFKIFKNKTSFFFKNNRSETFSNIWLRDHVKNSENWDFKTSQRTTFTAKLDLNIKVKKIRIEKAWIVSQFAGDFNPPHLHRGNISGVGYLKIPSSIKRNKEKDLAGLISFFDGRVSLPRNSPPLVKHRETFKPRVGDLYIFPSFLMHDVHPFRGDGERRCFSFNAFVDA